MPETMFEAESPEEDRQDGVRPIDVEEYAKEGLDEEEAESKLAVFITEVGGEPDDFEENKET